MAFERGAVAVVLAALVGCGAGQRGSGGADQRLTELEEAVARQGRALSRVAEKLDAMEGRLALLEERAKRLAFADPNEVYAVPIAGDPYQGPEHAWVTVVLGAEFACGFCERVRPTLKRLRAEYGVDLKLVYKDFIVHPEVAPTPARAACAAHAQGRYFEMADLLWQRAYHQRDYSRPLMVTLARQLRLDVARFERDMDGSCVDEVAADQEELARVGCIGAPTFYINGRYLSGARPFDELKLMIDEELARAKASGVAVDRYYEHLLATARRSVK